MSFPERKKRAKCWQYSIQHAFATLTFTAVVNEDPAFPNFMRVGKCILTL